MYCVNCGFQSVNATNFCAKCGYRTPRVEPPEQAWEHCMIIWTTSLGSIKQFQAVATGPYGSKVVAKKPAWKNSDPGHANRSYVASLVKKLSAEGWEPQLMGAEWYAHRFRRRMA